MKNDLLNWRIEAACLNAWPAPKQILTDGWLFRCAGGTTRRVNSANPLHAGADASDALIDRAEAFYGAQGRPTIFRVPEIAPAIDERLAARGYAVNAPTRTLYGEAGALAIGTAPEVRIETTPSRTWLAARNRLHGTSWQAGQAARAIIGAIALPGAYVSLAHRGRIAALAFGVVQEDLLVLESVITDVRYRRRGLGMACLCALLDWGRAQGASAAALQVMADNEAAQALYARLGFTHDLYGYHYRVKR